MKTCVVIDGPNLICRALDLGIENEKITKYLSVNKLWNNLLKNPLRQEFGSNFLFSGIEFICSNKTPSIGKKKLTIEQWKELKTRLSEEDAVSVTNIAISSNNEKGVDVAVATRLIEFSELSDIICLCSSDKDYIPVLEYLKKKGKYIVTIGIKEKHPLELLNLSYFFFDVTEFLHDLGSKPVTIYD